MFRRDLIEIARFCFELLAAIAPILLLSHMGWL